VPGAEDLVMAARPPLIKVMVNNPHILRRYKEEVGGFIAIRAHFSAIGLPGEPTFDNPEVEAMAWVEALLPWLEPVRPYTDLVILSNEAGQGNGEGTDTILARHATFDIVAAQRLNEHGYKVGGGAFSVGNPPGVGPALVANWRMYSQALEYIDALVLHEYGAPSMDVLDDQTWRCLRFQRVINILDNLGARPVPILIGECGIDWGVLGHPLTGWQGDQSRNIAATSPNDYITQLKWYDSRLEVEPRILGATIFNIGYEDWKSFDVRGLAELKDWMWAESLLTDGEPIVLPNLPYPDSPIPPEGSAPQPQDMDDTYNLGEGVEEWVTTFPQLTGKPLEPERYHHDNPTDPREVSYTRTEHGTAIWFKKTGAQFFYEEDSDILYRKNRQTGEFEEEAGWEPIT
jgi:hypothetical protein